MDAPMNGIGRRGSQRSMKPPWPPSSEARAVTSSSSGDSNDPRRNAMGSTFSAVRADGNGTRAVAPRVSPIAGDHVPARVALDGAAHVAALELAEREREGAAVAREHEPRHDAAGVLRQRVGGRGGDVVAEVGAGRGLLPARGELGGLRLRLLQRQRVGGSAAGARVRDEDVAVALALRLRRGRVGRREDVAALLERHVQDVAAGLAVEDPGHALLRVRDARELVRQVGDEEHAADDGLLGRGDRGRAPPKLPSFVPSITATRAPFWPPPGVMGAAEVTMPANAAGRARYVSRLIVPPMLWPSTTTRFGSTGYFSSIASRHARIPAASVASQECPSPRSVGIDLLPSHAST